MVLVNGNPSVQPLENEGLYLRTALLATEPESDPAQPANTPADTKLQKNDCLFTPWSSMTFRRTI